MLSIPLSGSSGSDAKTNSGSPSMNQEISKFLDDEEGLTAVEYAVAGALVVGTLIGAFAGLGEAAEEQIEVLTSALEGE